MKILLTGSGGFVGRSLAQALQADGHSLLGLDLQVSPDNGWEKPCDLRDIHALYRLAMPFEPDCIIHCGGVSGPMFMRDRPAEIVEINVNGTVNLLELARTLGTNSFLFCSSIAVYGPRSEGRVEVDENADLRPDTAYAASKMAAEAIVRSYAQQFGIAATSLRIGKVYGPGRASGCAMRDMIGAALAGQDIQLTDDGTYRHHFIHVDDVVRGIRHALEHVDRAGPVYNLVGQDRATSAEIAALVAREHDGVVVRLAPPGKEVEPEIPVPDGAAAVRDLGFSARTNLAQGIDAYSKWLAAAAR